MTSCYCTGACKVYPFICPAEMPQPWIPWEPKPPEPVGWQCPRCGRGVAPHKDYCDCYMHQGFTLSVSFGDKEKEEW